MRKNSGMAVFEALNVPLFAFVVSLLVIAFDARAAQILISQSTIGNVFTMGEPIEIPVRVSGAEWVSWNSKNFFGELGDEGSQLVEDEMVKIIPRLNVPGWYDLEIQAYNGSRLAATGRTTLAILAPLADSSKGSKFGVQTHFAQGWNTDIIPLIVKAGIKQVRDEQYWSKVEVHKGKFQFPVRYVDYVSMLSANQIEVLITLTFENELYDDGNTPYTESGRAGYARYSTEILHQYGAQISALEVWNEYNGTWCRGPCQEDRPFYYAAMLKETYEATKKQRPDVTIVGGATARIPLPYFKKLFERGALEYLDVLSIHPYGSTPTSVEEEIRALQHLERSYTKHTPKPIWVTEVSLQDTGPNGAQNVARFLVQSTSALLSVGVERIYWYLLRDYQNFNSMGLLHDAASPLGRYVPAPAYVAEANLIRQLGGAAFKGREASDLRTRIYRFRRYNQDCLVAWTITPTSTLIAVHTDAPITVTDMMGGTMEFTPKSGLVVIAADENPIYISGHIGEVRDLRRDSVIASSIDDFSNQQDGTGWSYGFYFAPPDVHYSPERFRPLVWNNDDWSYFWTTPGPSSIRISTGSAHPGNHLGLPAWAIRRWRSNFAGDIVISGTFSKGTRAGDGVKALIFVDGRVIYSTEIGGRLNPLTDNFSVSTSVHRGSIVDFAITPGPLQDIAFDNSSFSALITVSNEKLSETNIGFH